MPGQWAVRVKVQGEDEALEEEGEERGKVHAASPVRVEGGEGGQGDGEVTQDVAKEVGDRGVAWVVEEAWEEGYSEKKLVPRRVLVQGIQVGHADEPGWVVLWWRKYIPLSAS